MTIWSSEINELQKLYQSFKGQLPDLEKELEPLINTTDAIVVMVYSRRSLEVIITELCEKELNRPRKTEPMKGIIDKLNSDEKVPSSIITSMLNLNSLSAYGAHPKDFEPEQVKPVLNNLYTIIRWYLKYKEIQTTSLTTMEEELLKTKNQKISTLLSSESAEGKSKRTNYKSLKLYSTFLLIIIIIASLLFYKYYFTQKNTNSEFDKNITTNPVAFEWFMKAEFRLAPENKDDVDSCIFFLKNAIEADSLFALAHAELSQAYSIKNYFIDPKGGYSEKAYVEAEKSLYLNPDLAEGYFARAYSTWNFQNKFPHEKAIREYKQALSLKPNMSETYHQLGVVYFHVGLMDEAFEAYRNSLQINPDNKFAKVDLTSTYFFTGKIPDLLRMIELFKETPENLISPFRANQWATALIALGRYNEAENILSNGLKKDSSNLFFNSSLAILKIKKGDKATALKIIEFCERSNLNTGHFHHAVYNLAIAYALLGEYQKSVDKLNWVAENGLPNYPLFRDDTLLESLHGYGPYKELIKKLEITWNKYKQIAND